MLWTFLLLLPSVLAKQPPSNNTEISATTISSNTTTLIPSTSANATTTSANTTTFLAPTTSANTTEPPTSETGVITPTIAPSPFTPFPTPIQAPVAGVFISTDPNYPPTVGSENQSIPDFAPAWAAAYKKAREKIVAFSIEEKVNVTTGIGWANGRCVGNIPQVQDWPGLCLEDSPLGVRFGDFATVFPAAINVAATFNPTLMRARGLAMGQEHKGKGVNIALGPMMNMGRVANGGRNWEGFGADPFLTGVGAYETILGLQQGGVQACAKHFINNEQEHSRTMESSDVDDRTQHEIYAYPFLKSVMAGLTSVMCSYNLVNDTYACENDKMINGILKGEFGFQGFVMSDWGAQHSTISAMMGLDMSMPGDITFDSGTSYFGANLTAFVKNNTIPLARLDDMATRIIAGWYFLHQDSPSYPAVNFNAFHPDDEATNEHIDVQADHDELVRQIGAASTVLLKNINCTLPLKKPRSIVLVGSDAGPPIIGPNEFSDAGGDPSGTLAMGWGSGTANFTYLISPLEAIQARARKDRTSVSWMLENFDLARAGNVVIGKSAAIVFVNSDSGEGYLVVDGNEGDRNNLTAWHQGDQLIQAVAAWNNNTIVVLHSVGPLILEPWIEHPNITAVLWAGLPGTESGNALMDVLYGHVNPSGRLPYTIAKQTSDYPAQLVLGATDNEIVSIPYVEGLMIDYRHFDAMNITPRFEFGYGLSYTTFKYSNLNVRKIVNADSVQEDLENNWAAGMSSPQSEGSSAALWLHRPAYQVTFDLENTGAVAGAESPQVYLNMPASSGEPPSILRGFTNIEVQPYESKVVTITLSRFDLSIWDVVSQGYRKPVGTIMVTVGASSRDARLHGKIPE